MKKTLTKILFTAVLGLVQNAVFSQCPGGVVDVPTNSHCVGKVVHFYYPGSQTVSSWIITGATYKGESSSGGTLSLEWTGPSSNAKIEAVFPGGGACTDYFSVNSTPNSSVSISPTSVNITSGTSVTFYASPTLGGSSPTYTWYINGKAQSGTGSQFSYSNLQNGDRVKVQMKSSLPCSASVTSSEVVVSVTYSLTPPVVANVYIPFNTSTTLTASGAQTQNNEVYRWYASATGGTHEYEGLEFPTPVLDNHKDYYVAKYNRTSLAISQRVKQTVSVVVPPPDAPSLSTNTCGPKILTRGAPPAKTSWYWQDENGSSLSSSVTYTVDEADNRTYYLRAKATTGDIWSTPVSIKVTTDPVDIVLESYSASDPLAQATHSIKLQPPFKVSTGNSFNAKISIGSECNDYINWSEDIVYDQNGKPASKSRVYLDGHGKPLQNQTVDYLNSIVWASQPMYNELNEAVGATLSAPLLAHDFIYKKKFFTNASNEPYTSDDFTGSLLNNPNPAGNAPGTLGAYYSSQNIKEPRTPATAFPFSTTYTPPGPDPVNATISGAGEQHKMGSGHESVSEREYIGANELSHYYALRSYFLSSSFVYPQETIPVGHKYTSTDPDKNTVTTYVDADGFEIATRVQSGSTARWSYNYYNEMGQIVASIAPNGVNTSSTAKPNFVTLFKYDHLGRLIETTSPDEGTNRFVYSTDGKIRFSQNDEQANAKVGDVATPRFSYTNYDHFGRLVESGEYTCTAGAGLYVFEPHSTTSPVSNSVLNIVDINYPVDKDFETLNEAPAEEVFVGISEKLDPSRCSDHTFIKYDFVGNGLAPTDPAENLVGQVTKTKNENSETWYSYDEFGQLVWMKQALNGLPPKTVSYTYDYYGNVTEVNYQNSVSSEKLVHLYSYDKLQRLEKVSTKLNGSSTSTLQALHKYYLHGPLKRLELGSNIQGIDFLYNLDGSLKAINHADPVQDPGGDGIAGGTAFKPDVFGEILDYNTNDYDGANYNEGSFSLSATSYPDKYSGLVKSIWSHSHVDGHTPKAYAFKYTSFNELDVADWGSVGGSAGSYSFSPSATQAYQEDVELYIGTSSMGKYDRNGNIWGMRRRGKEGNVTDQFQYNYITGTNKLDNISGTTAIDYSYNAIGQVIQKTEGGQTLNISYTPYGLVKEIRDGSNKVLVSYHYDDRGNRYKKTLYQNGIPSLHSYYVHDASGNVLAVYEEIVGQTVKLIELPIYGAGRIATYKAIPKITFYEVSDHLGNVRGVIGKPDPVTFFNSMENNGDSDPNPETTTNPRVLENTWFRNLNETSVADIAYNKTTTIPDFPSYTTTKTYSSYLRWISGQSSGSTFLTQAVGPAIGLKVEPGDKIDMEVWSKFKEPTAGASYSRPGITATIASILAGNFVGTAAGIDVISKATDVFTSGITQVTAAVSIGNGNEPNTFPHAYMYYLLYDKNFKLITAGWKRVGEASKIAHDELASAQPHEKISNTAYISEPGYIYIFLANESENTEVWFDDFKVTNTRSDVVSGADYYPFGLAMENREITREDYRYGYQGQFSEEDKTTGFNEFELRFYDAKIGRWLSGDPYGQYYSPYMAMGNTPNMSVDPDGGIAASIAWTLGGMVAGGVVGGFLDEENPMRGAAIGMLAGAAAGYGMGQVNWSNISLPNIKMPSVSPDVISTGVQLLASTGKIILNFEYPEAWTPESNIDVISISRDKRLNHFRETTKYGNNQDYTHFVSDVYVLFEKNWKVKATGGYTTIVSQSYGKNLTTQFKPLKISKKMNEFITLVHKYNSGAFVGDHRGILQKYIDEMFKVPTDGTDKFGHPRRKNRNKAGSSRHY